MVYELKKVHTLLASFTTTLFLFTACGKKQQTISKKISGTKYRQEDVVGAAKRIDTPTPVGFSLLDSTISNTTSRLSYSGVLSQEQTYDFYRKEMERLGWALVDLSSVKESLLFCYKTAKYCAIRISHKPAKEHQTNIVLYIKEQPNGVNL